MELLAGRGSCVDQIFRDVGLAVDPHAAPDEIDEVELMPLARPLQVDAVVFHTFATQPVAQPKPVQQVDAGLFQDAGPDTCEHVVLRP